MMAQEQRAPTLDVDSLRFRYRARPEPALRDVSLTLRRGEPLLLAGTSGCGKTTLKSITERGCVQYAYREDHLITKLGPLSLPIVGWPLTLSITAEKTLFAVSQLVRMYAVTTMAMSIPYTINPTLCGLTFRGLGLHDRFAYGMDLAFRFVPTLESDFSITLDAQRARGNEVEKLTGGLTAQIRKLAPLLVPVTINAIVGAEDIIDAMVLRAFGVGPRTWVHQLTYDRRDRLLILVSMFIFVLSTGLSFMGVGRLWVPEALLRLATG